MHHPMLRPRLNESADTTRSRPESPPAKPTETDRKPLLTRYQARHGLDESPHRIDAYVPCLLSGLLTASDRVGSASSACLIGVVAGAPRTRAFRRGRVRCASRRRPAAVSIGRRQHPRRMGSARFELGALRLELYRLLVAPRLLAPLALGFVLGKVALHRGRGDAGGELVEHLRGGQPLADVLAVGVGQTVGVCQPLSDEQTEDDGESRLGPSSPAVAPRLLPRGLAPASARAVSGRWTCKRRSPVDPGTLHSELAGNCVDSVTSPATLSRRRGRAADTPHGLLQRPETIG
jgi:hypothetical protein